MKKIIKISLFIFLFFSFSVTYAFNENKKSEPKFWIEMLSDNTVHLHFSSPIRRNFVVTIKSCNPELFKFTSQINSMGGGNIPICSTVKQEEDIYRIENSLGDLVILTPKMVSKYTNIKVDLKWWNVGTSISTAKKIRRNFSINKIVDSQSSNLSVTSTASSSVNSVKNMTSKQKLELIGNQFGKNSETYKLVEQLISLGII